MIGRNPNWLICLFCVDDGTGAIHSQRDRESPGGLSPIVECMINGRALNEDVILLVNSLTSISEVARQNSGVFFVCSTQGENPWVLCNTLGLTQEQCEQFQSARVGEIICSNKQLFSKPVYATFSPPHVPGECDEIIRQASVSRFLAKVKTTPQAPLSSFQPPVPVDIPSTGAAPQSKTPEPPARSLAFMVQVATSAPAAMTKLYERLGLGAVQGRRVTKGLADAGLTRIHSFSTGRKGGQVCLVEITDAGWALLKNKGFLPPKRKTSGDWEHETAAWLIEVEGVRLGYRVSFEVPLGGIQVDVQWLDPKTGRRTLLNIGISRPAHEVETLEKFLQLPIAGQTKFVLVARDTRFAANVRTLLVGRDPKGDVLRRIEIKLITDFINA